MGDELNAVDLGAGRTVARITAGRRHTCALLDNGKVKCWGANDEAQLGLGDRDNRGDDAAEMGDNLPVVDLGTGYVAIAISAGERQTCALFEDNSVKCWGKNTQGQLGVGSWTHRGDGCLTAWTLSEPSTCSELGDDMGDNLPAVPLGTGRHAVDISVGYNHSCALLDDGSVKCWGSNREGELGQEDHGHRGDGCLTGLELGTDFYTCADLAEPGAELGDELLPINLGAGRTAVNIAASWLYTCALLDDASIKCWGDNRNGQLGKGDLLSRGGNANDMGDSLSPIPIGTGSSPIKIDASQFHICAFLDNGSVKCWGRNSFGQLGLGDNNDRGDEANELGETLAPVSLGTGRSVVEMATGYSHTCTLLNDGALKCWGLNSSGQLGLGDTDNRGASADQMGDSLNPVGVAPIQL